MKGNPTNAQIVIFDFLEQLFGTGRFVLGSHIDGKGSFDPVGTRSDLAVILAVVVVAVTVAILLLSHIRIGLFGVE